MAGGLDFHKTLNVEGKLGPATASLQNCLKFSHNCKYFSLLCDFGIAVIIKIQDESHFSTSPQASIYKKLKHGYGETLEGHSWSPDDEIYAVLGHKAYLYQVSSDFILLYAIPLYYTPRDITIATTSEGECTVEQLKYKTAIAGPNGVEIYDLVLKNSSIDVKEGIHLHKDLAIVLVEFSPDLQYLAVAALDCHFGIWNVKSLEGEQKDFWYKHLSTVRITNMDFSCDSQSVAVSCWDGVCYLYTRAQISTKGSKTSEWIQCNCLMQSSGERVCGMFTGTLVCWAPDCKSVRFSFANDEGSWLNTLSVKEQTTLTEKVSQKGVEVKGLDTLRCAAGDFSVCYLISKQLLLTRWHVQDEKATSKSHNATSDVVLYEDLACSVWLVPNEYKHDTGMTVKWVCHSDEELDQVKCLSTMLSSINSASISRHGQDNATGSEETCNSQTGDLSLVRNQEPPSTVEKKTHSTNVPDKTAIPHSTTVVKVPFYKPSNLLTHLSKYNPRHFIVASRSCIVLMVLPSVAYVYYHKSTEWKSIVFKEAVVSCCLVQENILVTLTANGVLSVWDFTRNSYITCLDSLPIEGLCETERWFVVGDLLQPLVLVFDVGSQEGTAIQIAFKDNALVQTKTVPVCVPTNYSQDTMTCYSMLGSSVFFLTRENNLCSVLLTELNLTYDTSYDERYSSLYQCIMENKEELFHFIKSKQQQS